jgi:hypothetical protein
LRNLKSFTIRHVLWRIFFYADDCCGNVLSGAESEERSFTRLAGSGGRRNPQAKQSKAPRDGDGVQRLCFAIEQAIASSLCEVAGNLC